MAAKEGQVSPISVHEFFLDENLESGEQCSHTPPLKSSTEHTECWMAPRKPVRRKVRKIVRTENGEMRVIISKKGLVLEDSDDFACSPLSSFPTLDMTVNQAHEAYSMAELGKAMLVDEGDRFLESTLRFCPNFEKRPDDDWRTTCKRRVDFVSSHPFMFPALVRH